MAMKRVIYRENGEVAITDLIGKGVTDRQCEKLKATHPFFKNCTWEDLDESMIPTRDNATRDKWRRDPAGGRVIIDDNVVLPHEAQGADMAALKAERDNPNPSAKEVARLTVKLLENKY